MGTSRGFTRRKYLLNLVWRDLEVSGGRQGDGHNLYTEYRGEHELARPDGHGS
jgi:hypothetical protein